MARETRETSRALRRIRACLSAFAVASAGCSMRGDASGAPVDEQIERLRDALADQGESLRVAHANNRTLLERIDDVEAAEMRARDLLEAERAAAGNRARESSRVEDERRSLLSAIDDANADYRRLQQSYESLRKLSDAYASEVDKLERERRDQDRVIALLEAERARSAADEATQVATRLELVRELESEQDRDRDVSRPHRFDAGSRRNLRAGVAAYYSLYRDDPSGLWKETQGLVIERFGSVFAGGARWDGFDLLLFGASAVAVFVLLYSIGAPLRALARRRAARELRILRRRVHELETQPSSGAPTARLWLGQRRTPIGERTAVSIRTFESIDPGIGRVDGETDGEVDGIDVDATLARVLPPEAAPIDALDSDEREVDAHVDTLYARIESGDGIETAPAAALVAAARADAESESGADAEQRIVIADENEITVTLETIDDETGSVESIIVARAPSTPAPAATIETMIGTGEISADAAAQVADGDTTIIADPARAIEPEGPLPADDTMQSPALDETRLNDTSMSPTLILDTPHEIEALRAGLVAEEIDGDDTEPIPELLVLLDQRRRERAGDAAQARNANPGARKVEEAGRDKRRPGAVPAGNTAMLAELESLIGEEFDAL